MNVKNTSDQQEEARLKRNALGISLITGILFLVVSVFAVIVGYQENGMNGLWGGAITGFISLAAFFSSIQAYRGRTSIGIGFLIFAILLVSFAIPIVAQGHGLALSILVLVVVASISSTTLSAKWTTRSIIIAFIVAAAIILIDLYLPDLGLPGNPTYINIVALVTSLAYIAFILRSFNTYSLRTKIITAFTLITITPLVTLGYFYSLSSTRILENQSKLQLTNIAKIQAESVDNFITNQIDSVHADAKQLAFVEYLRLPAAARSGSVKELNARLALLALTRRDPVFIHSIAILDTDGTNLIDTFEDYKGQTENSLIYFVRPMQTGLPFASNILFQNNRNHIYFSAPIKSQNGNTIGILRVEYHATIIQAIVRSVDPLNAGTTLSLVDTNTYLRVAYTGDRDELFKTYKDFSAPDLAVLQSEGRLPSISIESLLTETDVAMVDGIDNLQQQSFFDATSKSLGSTTNTGVFLETQPWVAIVRQSKSNYLAPVEDQNRTTILISLIMVILSIGAGFLASQVITSPLLTLAKTAEQIAVGNRSARAEAVTEDEIGLLAKSFNRMTDELNQAFKNLEIRVVERTTDLEIARRQSEKRASELQAIGEISKVITGEQALEKLLPLISRLVSERFGFYHTGIFLLNETNQFAVLQAASSEGGQKMLERGHKLEVGESGIVGYVAKFGMPRISLDVGHDAVFFNNPDLPNTRSEMALPLKVRNRIVGVLDVQSEKPGAFTEYDASTLSILADQIAIALENARLFTQNQQALAEAQAQYRQNLQSSWRVFSREEETIGYHQGLMGGKKISKPVETEEIREAINRGNVLVLNSETDKQEATIVVPIKLRGQIIGTMNIKAPSANRTWSRNEVNLAEAISERLSLALENARLIQESQRQVIKEQTISEVTGKIGASINLKSVLQTAVEELGHAIPGSEVLIEFEQKNENME
ncbi:MAG TPA: GAF domain-containing protein [Anaerolineales bacterium]|nr:GAF domain-containing protein [Anaerolineales bacterium]